MESLILKSHLEHDLDISVAQTADNCYLTMVLQSLICVNKDECFLQIWKDLKLIGNQYTGAEVSSMRYL